MSDIDDLKESWNRLGEYNAFWAVLSDKKKWDQEEFFKKGRQEIEHVLGVLKTHKAKVHFGTALDFGSGLGRLTQALGAHFSKVVGVDIAASMIKQSQELNKLKNVSFKHVTTGDLSPFSNDSIDFAFTDIVFQHMNNDLTRGYLKEMFRVLKSGGVLVFQLPSTAAVTWKGLLIKTLPDSVLTKLRKGMEMHPIKRDELLRYLAEVGYEVITVEKDANHKHWNAYFYYVRKP